MKCGIVDVGSNTIQLSVYRYANGTTDTLFNQWETVGLAGYVQDGVLSPDGISAACRTLLRFRRLLSNLDIADMHVFATASLRNLSNSQAVLDAILTQTGLALTVLSGGEEAEYAFRGALMGGAPSSGLLADVGGGSTELVVYKNGTLTVGASLPVGVVTLFSRFVDGLLPTRHELDDMEHYVATLLDTAHLAPAHVLLGVGGTARAIVALCNTRAGADGDRRTVSICEVNSLYTYLTAGSKDARRLLLRTVPDRIHTVLPGLVLFTSILARCGGEHLTMSATGVREGFLAARVIV